MQDALKVITGESACKGRHTQEFLTLSSCYKDPGASDNATLFGTDNS